MISGSPLMESDGIFYAHLEKIIVDLYCDWNKIYPYKKPTFYLLFKKLNKDYSINESKLLRYADRRKKKQVFTKFLDRLKSNLLKKRISANSKTIFCHIFADNGII